LEGTLEVALFDNGKIAFAPANGDSFAILSAADGFQGEFDEVNLPTLGPLLAWEMERSAHEVVLRAVPALAGDYNANGEVDAADYVVWRSLAGKTEGQLAADGTGPDGVRDGVVNDWDYNLWRANFGAQLMSDDTAAAGGVPEPSASLLALFALVICCSSAARSRRAGRRIAHG
jgi:hypothetical protein